MYIGLHECIWRCGCWLIQNLHADVPWDMQYSRLKIVHIFYRKPACMHVHAHINPFFLSWMQLMRRLIYTHIHVYACILNFCASKKDSYVFVRGQGVHGWKLTHTHTHNTTHHNTVTHTNKDSIILDDMAFF
jgi:hypothetical protein